MQLSNWYCLLGTVLLCTAAGCGNSDSASVDVDADLMSELLGPEDGSQEANADEAEPSESGAVEESDTGAVQTASNSSKPKKQTRSKTAPVGEKLELRLRQGDRFPLVKTIKQKLVQRSDVVPAEAHTSLELTLIITVEEVKPDAILLGVQYSRVAYQHDINGQRLNYDSASHQGSVPWDAIPYAGMINNGFAFWLGRDNSIRELVG